MADTAQLSLVESVDTTYFWVIFAMIILLLTAVGEQRCAAALPVGKIGVARATAAGWDRPACTSGYHLSERSVPRLHAEVRETALDGARA